MTPTTDRIRIEINGPVLRERAAIERVVESGRFVLGPELERFESSLAEFVGTQHAIGTSSGTDALTMILEALDVRGRAVIVPALTFIGTAEAVVHAGGYPVFADVDSDTWTLTHHTVKPWLVANPRAVVAVDLFGNPAPLDTLRSFLHPNVALVEDACQAIGASLYDQRCGSMGDAAAFSFYPSKALACMGDGGAVTTNSTEIANSIRTLRSHGSLDNVQHASVGRTARLDEIQAAVLSERLPGVPAKVERLRQRLTLSDQIPTPGGYHSAHQIVKLGPESENETGVRTFYDPPLHMQPAMRKFFKAALPVAEDFAKRNYVVPVVEDGHEREAQGDLHDQ